MRDRLAALEQEMRINAYRITAEYHSGDREPGTVFQGRTCVSCG